MSSFVDLLQGAKVVHPVEFCSLLNMVVSTDHQVHLVRSLSKSSGQLGPHVLGSRFNSHLVTSSQLLQLKVSHHIVGKLVSICRLSSSTHDLVRTQVHYLLLIVLEGEDRSVHSGVSHDDNPVFACDSEYSVHYN